MNQPEDLTARLHREKIIHCYVTALTRGDMDEVISALAEAEHDPELEEILLEINVGYWTQARQAIEAGDAAQVRALIQEHLPSATLPETDEADPPPLTVGDVVARLQADQAAGPLAQEARDVARRLHDADSPLPRTLSQRSMGKLFRQLGVSVSVQFQRLFRETAIYLSIGRTQGMRLAATRRQQEQRPPSESQNSEESAT